MAKKKFDTNPLDPEFPEKVREAQTTALPNANSAETRKFAEISDTEEQTRQFNDANFGAYAYQQGQPPQTYQTSRLEDMNKSSSRKVAKVGLPENVLVALPYLPFWIGLVMGLLELFFVPKSEQKVRFHAAQGVAAHIGILIVTTVLGGIGNITNLANFGNFIFQIFTFVMLIIFTVKAFKGKPVHIEPVDDLTEWLEDKIKPLK
jgi:uncharacterized membrane protein